MPEVQPAAPAAAAAPIAPAAAAAAAPAAAAPAAPPLPAAPAAAAAPVAEPAKPAAAAPANPPPAPASTPAPAPAAATPAAEIEIKLAEGAKYDPAAIGKFKSIFADEKMTPSQRAQAVIELDREMAVAQQKRNTEKMEALRKADVEVLKADKEFGGDRYEKTVARSRDAMNLSKHGEAFGKLLVATGLDNHPDAVRFFADLRSKFSEDSTSSRAPGSKPPGDGKGDRPMSRHERWKQQYLPEAKK